MEFFEVTNMLEAKRNIKIALFFIAVPCGVWWADFISKIFSFIFGKRD